MDVDESALGKVPNADTIDGFDSEQLVQGDARISANRETIPIRVNAPILTIPGFGEVSALCGSDHVNGHVDIRGPNLNGFGDSYVNVEANRWDHRARVGTRQPTRQRQLLPVAEPD